MEEIRIDKWLCAMRIYKTRSEAADACKHGKVIINNIECKPSRIVKTGEIITVRKLPVVYTYRVIDVTENRQPAKNVSQYAENLTPQEELDKLDAKSPAIFVHRDKGSGRPTKKERRTLDNLLNELNS
ncbi:MAG: RNA-binding S4 domain-containing protein [Prevotellaceae bacterium]|jgi:ribosome-associated heat shock protein Hsp15|nr:RNA-binding S4 domain-containing protein [Prevotellaceae bacterium]